MLPKIGNFADTYKDLGSEDKTKFCRKLSNVVLDLMKKFSIGFDEENVVSNSLVFIINIPNIHA